MLSIKLHEATRQFKISNKLAMFFLEKKHVPVKSHSSVITMEQLEMLREFSGNKDKFAPILEEFNRLEKEKKRRQKKAKSDKPKEETEKEPPIAESQEPTPPKPVLEKPIETKPKTESTAPDKQRPEPVPEKPKPAATIPPKEQPDHARKQEIRPPKPEYTKEPAKENRPEAKPATRPTPKPTPKPEHKEQYRDKKEHRPHRPADEQKAPGEARKDRPPRGEHRVEQKTEHKGDKKPHRTEHPERKKENRLQRPKERTLQIVARAEKPGALSRMEKANKQPSIQPPPPKDPRRPAPPADHRRPAPPAESRRPGPPADPKRPAPPTERRQQPEHRKDKPKPEAREFRKEKQDPRERDLKNRPTKRKDQRQGGKRIQGRSDFDSRRIKEQKKKPEPVKKKERILDLPDLIQTSDQIIVKQLADLLNIKLKDIEDKMRELKNDGMEFHTNQILEADEIKFICETFGVEVDIVSYEDDLYYRYIEKNKAELTPRAPVVTVMGHVDHGKTTLLDTLRNSRVAAREAGGITQKIGAYKLEHKEHEIVFIDTPGHEAFTNIRARGAKVTDIVVLMVAANDGVQPQTVEAINHARSANVPIVVAINKIDLDGADPSRVKQELTKYNLVVEDWGGDVVSVEISAKQNKNLDSLLEMLTLVSEMLELKAYKTIPARGFIIESHLDPKLGPMGTVLLQHGQLKRGDFFICGNSVGKVKSIFDDQGKVLPQAEVPMPIEIMGFDEVPEAGELFQVTDDIDKARKVVDTRKQHEKDSKKDEAFAEKRISLENLFQKLQDDKTKEFPIIIKTDNFSSAEVLEAILLKQDHEQLKINIVHKGVGNMTESDVLLAATSGAMIVGFNVKAPQKLLALAKREQVEIKLYNVIYHLIEDVEKAIKGEIEPEYIESLIGKAEVLQTFKISKIGIIAGCLVKEGKVTKKSKVKVLRSNDLVFEGDLETLKRVKNEASEVNAGTECGIRIKNFNAIEAGDTLEFYEVKIKE